MVFQVVVGFAFAFGAFQAIAGSTCNEQAVSRDGKPLHGAARAAFLRFCSRQEGQENPQVVPPPSDCRNNTLTVKKADDGHFYVVGALNGTPLQFLVDTGATTTTISSSFAIRAGIVGSRSARFSTAGGQVTGTFADDVILSFGVLEFRKTRVAVNPSYSERFGLLGQNVLAKFSVSINGAIMTLVPTNSKGENCAGDWTAPQTRVVNDVKEISVRLYT